LETTAPNSATTPTTTTKTDQQVAIQKLIAASMWDRIDDVGGFVTAMGKAFSDSGLFGCTPTQGMVIALNCLVTKTPPLELATTDHIVQGAKPQLTMRADAMLAGFMKRGGKILWKNQGDDGVEARAVFTTKDGNRLEIAYSMQNARQAGLLKKGGGYDKDPGAQLRARLYSKAIRMLDPEVVSGRYCPEDLDPDAVVDYVPVRNEERVQPLNLGKAQDTSEPASVVVATGTTAGVVGAVAGMFAGDAAPVVATAPATPTLDAGVPMITQAQQGEMIDLRKKLGIGKEKWTEILSKPKYGVTSALHLTEDKAGMLLAGMRTMLERQALSTWANQGVSPIAAQNSAPAVAADTPPFDVPAS